MEHICGLAAEVWSGKSKAIHFCHLHCRALGSIIDKSLTQVRTCSPPATHCGFNLSRTDIIFSWQGSPLHWLNYDLTDKDNAPLQDLTFSPLKYFRFLICVLLPLCRRNVFFSVTLPRFSEVLVQRRRGDNYTLQCFCGHLRWVASEVKLGFKLIINHVFCQSCHRTCVGRGVAI